MRPFTNTRSKHGQTHFAAGKASSQRNLKPAFPIFGAKSNNAARAAIAARLQPDKYVAFHFALMNETGEIGANEIVDAAHKAGLDVNKLMADLAAPAISKEMAAAHSLAARTGIDGTPFFIINGEAHSGEIDDTALKKLADG